MAKTLMALSVPERMALTAVVRKIGTPLATLRTENLLDIISEPGFLRAPKLEVSFLMALYEEALLRNVIKPTLALPWRMDRLNSKDSDTNCTPLLDQAIDDLIESSRAGGRGADGLELLAPVMYGYDLKSDGLDIFSSNLRTEAAQAVKRALWRQGIPDQMVCKAYSNSASNAIRHLQPIFDIALEIESSPDVDVRASNEVGPKGKSTNIADNDAQSAASSGLFIAVPLAIAFGYLLGKFF